MAEPAELVVFLHGLGAGPESWDAQVSNLPPGFVGVAARIPGTRDADGVGFSLTAAAESLNAVLDDNHVERAHVCGLSLGGMVATRFAIDNPERVSSLVLSGSQLHPSRTLIWLQCGLLGIAPSRMEDPAGMSKATVLSVLRGVQGVDLRPELGGIVAPTLVLCGSKDRPNLRAARQLAAGIPAADLEIVDGAGHQWNTDLPERFCARLNAFLEVRRPGAH